MTGLLFSFLSASEFVRALRRSEDEGGGAFVGLLGGVANMASSSLDVRDDTTYGVLILFEIVFL
eukprot:CAMPEP_0182499442 /NCGR_PEP_ID=MMETSP1321-20130603/7690_1 /TAXON_ID=91990 /ORGANISM="Bolidomonas sp., Strain RCC1657" /LENGTH=63 /DNA_ID=CAMNT_0024703645 /DNA_START=361 /DNA_END=552 /DNA_ORIENTATION=+